MKRVRPWNNPPSHSLRRSRRGPAFTFRANPGGEFVAARVLGGVTCGYWAGPVQHVRGRVKLVTLERAYRRSDKLLRAELEGCGLVGVFEVKPRK